MGPLAVVLWLWLAVSLAVYGYRIYRRVSNGPRTKGEGQDPSVPDPSDPSAPSDPNRPVGPATALIQNPVQGFEAPASDDALAATPDPPPTPADASPIDAPPAGARLVDSSGVDAHVSQGPPAHDPVPAPPVGSGEVPSALPANERRAPRQPMSDAVTGIRLPCDLAPLVGAATKIDPFDVAFFTTTHDGENVRSAISGELDRLGFQVAPTAAFRLSASRPDAEVVVTIYPDPTNATEAGRPLYPTAAPDWVVVRFQS